MCAEWSPCIGTDLQFGPLDPADAPDGVPPGEFGSVDELGFGELVSPGGVDLLLDLLPAGGVCGAAGSARKFQMKFSVKN